MCAKCYELRYMLVRERSALSDPYCQSAWNSVSLFVCGFVRNFEVKYLGNQRSQLLWGAYRKWWRATE